MDIPTGSVQPTIDINANVAGWRSTFCSEHRQHIVSKVVEVLAKCINGPTSAALTDDPRLKTMATTYVVSSIDTELTYDNFLQKIATKIYDLEEKIKPGTTQVAEPQPAVLQGIIVQLKNWNVNN